MSKLTRKDDDEDVRRVDEIEAGFQTKARHFDAMPSVKLLHHIEFGVANINGTETLVVRIDNDLHTVDLTKV